MSINIDPENLEFLQLLEINNNREWFNENKKEFKRNEENVKNFFQAIYNNLKIHDQVDRIKIFRIYRDVRFSKNKLPYKTHFSSSFHRVKPAFRGGYYVHLQPKDKSYISTGFWDPNKEDLLRIRKELEMDSKELRNIIGQKNFRSIWGQLQGEELKTAPRDFDKDHPGIGLIRKKQFIFRKSFTDSQVTAPDFLLQIDKAFQGIRPYFDFMSEVLTTNLNGESLMEKD